MLFGKIEYLNLLPFHVFMKRYLRSSSEKLAMNNKKNVPATINHLYHTRRVDAAFISSITAKKERFVPLGIVAKKEVLSVLVLPNTSDEHDSESATSNVLAHVLKVQGKVMIGDKALRHHLNGGAGIDLAKLWYERYQLPFVFALLCHHGHNSSMKRLSQRFLKSRVYIPQYLLENASKRTQIPKKDILNYLQYISYEVDAKALKSVQKFWRMSAKDF